MDEVRELLAAYARQTPESDAVDREMAASAAFQALAKVLDVCDRVKGRGELSRAVAQTFRATIHAELLRAKLARQEF